MASLDELRGILTQGQKLSGQSAYQRRAPAKKSLPYLLQARTGLSQFTKDHRDNAEAWRLLSLADENLLQYGAAVRCLERAMALAATKNHKDLKRLYLLKESSADWEKLMLGPDQLHALGNHLDVELARRPCDHSLSLTRRWLEDNQIPRLEKVLSAIQNFGGYCDCEVLYNVVAD